VEDRGVELRFAVCIRLLVLALLYEDALWRALFFADLAGDTAHPLVPVRAIVDQKREVARSLDLRRALLRILDRGQPVFADEAAEEVPRRLRHSLQMPSPTT